MTLEERIDRIVHTSEIELVGEAYKGKYELNDGKSMKKFILDKLRKVYTNLSTGDKITISHESAGKLAKHLKDGEEYQKALAHIPEIIEKMQFLEEMPPDKNDAKYSKYSYYITPANIDGKPHTILSTVGYKGGEIYYDHNIFKGTPEEVFARTKNETNNPKYDRLNKILQETKEGNRGQILVQTRETSEASTNKYTKNSPDV
ncbi:MAG: hypothetical protein LBC87_08025 [Fibromonadaceae bacterium]|nr:hypothetical protein [Fibromonadaceae bacterium]